MRNLPKYGKIKHIDLTQQGRAGEFEWAILYLVPLGSFLGCERYRDKFAAAKYLRGRVLHEGIVSAFPMPVVKKVAGS